MDVQDVVLTAGERIPLKVPGRFFMLIATGAPLTVRFKKALSTFREVARNVEAGYQSFPGDWADESDSFDGLEFESPIAQTIKVGISDRAANYFRTVGIVEVEGPNDGQTDPDFAVLAASEVCAAGNANRELIHIQNTGPNNCRTAPGVVGVARGTRLVPGQSATFRTTAAINCIREVGANPTTVSITEETRT